MTPPGCRTGNSSRTRLFKSGVFGLYRNRPGSDAPADSLLATESIGFTGYWLPDASALVTVGQDLRPGSDGDIALSGMPVEDRSSR